MKIEGFIGSGGHAYVMTYLLCNRLEIAGPTAFLINLGASTTTLLEGDVDRLHIDVNKLQKSDLPVTVCGGVIYPYRSPPIELKFLTTDRKIQTEELGSIDILNPNESKDRPTFSLLGLDLLKRYKLIYDKGKSITLEK
jgi:hypothetical protein